jgi:outer membrane protein assembly factor BamB
VESSGSCPPPTLPQNYPDGRLLVWPWEFLGFAGTSAVVDGEVFCATIESKVYCLNAASGAVKWTVDLLHADLAHKQYVDHGLVLSSCWTSPLVVNGRVFVGVGRGDDGSPDPHDRAGFGFVYCLDAATGDVVWLFCTNRFQTNADNKPNQIPQSVVGTSSLSLPFVSLSDPPNRGAAVWSSCAYDATLNRIYVGTGNSAGGGFPGPQYSNGILSLDADSGKLKGFFAPSQSDAYAPTDDDLDMSGSPTLFTNGYGDRVVGIGGKSGSYFLLTADGLSRIAGRQLLPYKNGQPISGPAGGSINSGGDYGIFTAASVDNVGGRLFVAMGGAVDSASTPILRALRWGDLNDAWPTAISDGVTRYSVPGAQQLYQSWPKPKLCYSSPLIVNGVVLVTTSAYSPSPAAIYAFDCASGATLWSDAVDQLSLGPALWPGGVIAVGGRTLRRWAVQPTNPLPVRPTDIVPQITPLLLRK